MLNVRNFTTFVIGLVLLLGVSANAFALNLTGANDTSLHAFVDFGYANGTATIGITNTSDAYSPLITGFAFNVPSAVTGLTSFSILDVQNPVESLEWTGFFDTDDLDLPQPYGFFDSGSLAGVKKKFNGGGDPQNGIQVGQIVTFEFVFEGTGLDALTADDFLNAVSYVPNQGKGSNGIPTEFIARFQQAGFDGEGSDVAIPGFGGPEGPEPPVGVSPVPEPATLILVGLGSIGLGWLRRKG